MEKKRKIEVFTAGCPVCQGVVDMVKELACPHCESTFYNLNNNEGVEQAKAYGVTAVPAVAVNGALLECCKRRPITREDLKAAGLGEPL
ncbi:MAG: thioredoxin family protein [Thermodesulfobacteriota bacterium]